MRHAANLVVFDLASSRLKPVLPTACTCRTGFSREEAGVATTISAECTHPHCLIMPTLRVGMHPGTLCVQTRLKPVSLTVRAAVSGTGFSREEAGMAAIDFLANTIHVGVSLLTKTAFRTLKI